MNSLDRRTFIRGTSGFALALPWLETLTQAATPSQQPKRLACFYMPDGVPMPLKEDPAFQDWSWFPHGSGKDFKLTKCLEPLESLRNEVRSSVGCLIRRFAPSTDTRTRISS